MKPNNKIKNWQKKRKLHKGYIKLDSLKVGKNSSIFIQDVFIEKNPFSSIPTEKIIISCDLSLDI